MSSIRANNNCEDELKAWKLAASGDLEGLKALYTSTSSYKQFVLDMALIGAATTKCRATKEWAWLNGASILWDIQQNQTNVYRHNDTNNKLKMLGGPGEISKGFFNHRE